LTAMWQNIPGITLLCEFVDLRAVKSQICLSLLSYETAPPEDPTVGLCLGAYDGPRGGLEFRVQGLGVGL